VRYRESSFALKAVRGVKTTWELYELESRSCPGCAQCLSIFDDLREFPDRVELDPALQNGDMAVLSIKVDSVDWETGHADDWHVVATKVAPC
jgi:hypothetical protein